MGFTPEQIKGRIKSVAKQNNADARTLMRIYMMERFLERLAQSEYRDNFIIKGGILVTAMIGVAHRSTMDIDTSMKNLNLSAEDALRVVNQVKDIDLDDGVSFEVKDVSNIMDEMEYPGIRVTMNANVGRLITPLKIDISTGDVITPRAIEFNYDLLLEDRSISLWSYNLETILAEKLQTVLARGILNTRMRDFYDIRILLDTYEDKVNKAVLKDAFAATCKKRGTDHLQEQAEEIIKIIEANTKSKFVTDAMMWFDKFSCKRSDLIITVGRDLVETVERRFNGKNVPKTVMINNWIDENEIYPLESDNERVVAFKRKYGLDGKFVIMYSGNIGLYYDLENLIKVVEKFGAGTKTADGREVVFAFVGAGSVLKTLEDYVAEHNMENVVFIPYQDKADLIYSLNAGDVHWCVNAKGIKGVSCPSKYYGLASAARPVIGVLESGSEIRCIIEDTKGGLCCEPGEYDKVEENIRWFINRLSKNYLDLLVAVLMYHRGQASID